MIELLYVHSLNSDHLLILLNEIKHMKICTIKEIGNKT